MELFGIVLSIPVAFVASMLYCLFLDRVVLKFERPSRLLRYTSYFVLAFFVVELVLLLTLGSVRTRGILGPSFYVAHVIFFFIGVPALANSLVLRQRRGFFARWYVAGALCTVFAFLLVLLQYSVSESLYGIDGENGPYSKVVMNDSAPTHGSVARPEATTAPGVHPRALTVTPQSVVQQMFPGAQKRAANVDCFRSLTAQMSIYMAVEKCGRPDEETGSGLYIFVWNLRDGSTVAIGTPYLERIDHITYTEPSGKSVPLLRTK